MKADRRHELRENELAAALLQARDFVGQNARTITLALGGVILVAILASFGMRSRAAQREDQWRRLSQLDFNIPEKAREALPTLRSLAFDAGDDKFRMIALVELGRQAMKMSQQSDAPPNIEMLNLARSAYEQLVERFRSSPLAVATGHLGLATVAEDMYLLTREERYKSEVRRHLSAVVEDDRLATLPLYQVAVDRRNALEATLSIVAFAVPPVEAPPVPPVLPGIDPVQAEESGFNVEFQIMTPEGVKTIKPTLDIRLPPGKAIPDSMPDDEVPPADSPPPPEEEP
jgi:hypothetical protein